jgi:hypothetical protein
MSSKNNQLSSAEGRREAGAATPTFSLKKQRGGSHWGRGKPISIYLIFMEKVGVEVKQRRKKECDFCRKENRKFSRNVLCRIVKFPVFVYNS